jgi:hypothetical protein
MFLRYDALSGHGVEVRPHDDGLELIPQTKWSSKAQTNFRDFCLGIGLTEQESDELAGYATTISIMGAIKKAMS